MRGMWGTDQWEVQWGELEAGGGPGLWMRRVLRKVAHWVVRGGGRWYLGMVALWGAWVGFFCLGGILEAAGGCGGASGAGVRGVCGVADWGKRALGAGGWVCGSCVQGVMVCASGAWAVGVGGAGDGGGWERGVGMDFWSYVAGWGPCGGAGARTWD